MWFIPAFGSALLGAIDIILCKKCLKHVSSALLAWTMFTLSIPPIAYFAFREGVPQTTKPLFYAGVIGSALAYVFSKTISNETLKHHDVSKVFPLTSFNGFFLYILGLLFLSESIRPVPVIGLMAVVAGSYILNAGDARENFLEPFRILFTNRSSLLYLFSILLSGITTIFDKTAINNSSPTSPIFTLLVENILMSGFLGAYLWKNEKHSWISGFRNDWKRLSVLSAVYTIESLLIFEAVGGGPVALVMGVKRLQIFFILILGYFFLNDKPSKHSWIASAIMAAGVLLIKLG